MDRYLEVKNISVRLGKRTILKELDFSVKKGEFWCLLGPNGSGKTTFLRTLGGWLQPLEGQVLLDGKDLNKLPRKLVAQKIGMVAVEEGNNSFTVEETVLMGRFARFGRFGQAHPEDEEKVQSAMEAVGILHKRNCLLTHLSQGERQKVWVARALAQEVELLLLDEPTSHLDVKSQSEVFLLLEKLCREEKLAVIAILHDINLAMAFSSHLILLRQGRIEHQGRKEEILDEEKLGSLYEIPFELDKDADGAYWARICYRRKDAENDKQ